MAVESANPVVKVQQTRFGRRFTAAWVQARRIARLLVSPLAVVPATGRARLGLEELEIRTTPDVSWSAIGPSPQANPLGDVAGRVAALAWSKDVDPKAGDQPALFLGSAGGGIWRMREDTSRWEQVSDRLVDATAKTPVALTVTPSGVNNIGALAVDPNNSMNIVAGTGEANYASDNGYGAGILRSEDGGKTWALVNTQFQGYSVAKIVFDPTDKDAAKTGGTLYAAVVRAGIYTNVQASKMGIWKSTNGGKDWERFNLPFQLDANTDGGKKWPLFVTDLDSTKDKNGRFMLIAGVGKLLTTDGGDERQTGVWVWRETNNKYAWEHAVAPNPNMPVFGRVVVAVTKDDTNFPVPQVYAALASTRGYGKKDPNDPVSELVDISRFTLAPGEKIEPQSIMPAQAADRTSLVTTIGDRAWYYLTIGVSTHVGKNSSTPAVYLGGRDAVQGNGQGDWWLISSTDKRNVTQGSQPHVDHHAWAFPARPADQLPTIYNGNDGGVWAFQPAAAQTKGTGTWTNKNAGLSTTLVNSVGTSFKSEANPGEAKQFAIIGSQDNGVARFIGSTKLKDLPPTDSPLGDWKTVADGDGGVVRVSQDGERAYYMIGGSGGLQIFRVDKDTAEGFKTPEDLTKQGQIQKFFGRGLDRVGVTKVGGKNRSLMAD